MATKAQLVTRLKTVIQDGSFSDTLLLSILNEGVSRITGGIRLPDGSLSPPMPDLFKTTTVTATTTQNYVALPADFQRNLFWVYSTAANAMIPFKDDMIELLRGDNNLDDTGAISLCVRKGNSLYYWPTPSTNDTLRVYYYRTPVDMTTDTTTPDGIPAHLQYPLLVNYAAKELFSQMLDRNAAKNRGQFHEIEFFKAMQDLVDYVGLPEAVPKNFNVDMTGDF